MLRQATSKGMELKESTTIAAVGVPYTLYDSPKAGFVGGIISTRNMAVGDTVELTISVAEPSKDGQWYLVLHKRCTVRNQQPTPMVSIDELYMPYGGCVVLQQTEGQPRKFWYSIYRR